jgi:hypothetical protein
MPLMGLDLGPSRFAMLGKKMNSLIELVRTFGGALSGAANSIHKASKGPLDSPYLKIELRGDFVHGSIQHKVGNQRSKGNA